MEFDGVAAWDEDRGLERALGSFNTELELGGQASIGDIQEIPTARTTRPTIELDSPIKSGPQAHTLLVLSLPRVHITHQPLRCDPNPQITLYCSQLYPLALVGLVLANCGLMISNHSPTLLQLTAPMCTFLHNDPTCISYFRIPGWRGTTLVPTSLIAWRGRSYRMPPQRKENTHSVHIGVSKHSSRIR